MVKHLDIVTPCFNEEECVALFYDEVQSVMSSLENYTYTIYYIDDGSRDNTSGEIKKLVSKHGAEKVKYISFSRNFGKEAAIYAGLKATTGDLVVLMDADLQHPPSMLNQMIGVIEEGFDSCATHRKERLGESPVRTIFSKAFYKFFNLISSVKIDASATDYRMMTRKMVNAVLMLSERERFTKGLFQWVGFETKLIVCESVPRTAGTSKWRFGSLFGYAVNGIVAFSTAPLRIASLLGFIIFILGIIYAVYMFVGAVFFGRAGGGFVTTVLLLLVIGGIIIMLLGIIGEYIARIYTEIKQRPIYIEKDSNINAQLREGGAEDAK